MFPYYIFTAYLMRVPNRCSFVAQTKHCIMENTTEITNLQIVRMKDDNGCHSDKRGKKHSPTGSFNVSDLSKSINVLENRPMWIDNSEIQSVTELCDKCRRMKEEHHVQFAVIDDFLKALIPQSVWEGREAPDAPYKQLSQLAKELDIVIVALSLPSIFHVNE